MTKFSLSLSFSLWDWGWSLYIDILVIFVFKNPLVRAFHNSWILLLSGLIYHDNIDQILGINYLCLTVPGDGRKLETKTRVMAMVSNWFLEDSNVLSG